MSLSLCLFVPPQQFPEVLLPGEQQQGGVQHCCSRAHAHTLDHQGRLALRTIEYEPRQGPERTAGDQGGQQAFQQRRNPTRRGVRVCSME